jgi:hypothetical protein
MPDSASNFFLPEKTSKTKQPTASKGNHLIASGKPILLVYFALYRPTLDDKALRKTRCLPPNPTKVVTPLYVIRRNVPLAEVPFLTAVPDGPVFAKDPQDSAGGGGHAGSKTEPPVLSMPAS